MPTTYLIVDTEQGPPVEHVVFYPGPDGNEAFRRLPTLEDAVRFVEHLRNVAGVDSFSVHALSEVPLSFRAYYRVEVPSAPVESAAAAPVAPVAPAPVAPAVEVPVVEVPSVEVPVVEVPSVEVPSVEVPSVEDSAPEAPAQPAEGLTEAPVEAPADLDAALAALVPPAREESTEELQPATGAELNGHHAEGPRGLGFFAN